MTMKVNGYLEDPSACDVERRVTRTSLRAPGDADYWRMRDSLNTGGGSAGSATSSASSEGSPSPGYPGELGRGQGELVENENGEGNGEGNGNGIGAGADWRERYRFEAKLPMLPETKVFRPRDLNLERVEFSAEQVLLSNELEVEGYRHFQVCFQVENTDALASVVVAVAKGVYRFPEVGVQRTPAGPDFTSQGTSPFVDIGTIAPPSTSEYHSLYFGTELAITPGSLGDTIRLGRTIQLSFTNNNIASTFLSAWLECAR